MLIFVCEYVCLHTYELTPRLSVTNGVIWALYNWLNKIVIALAVNTMDGFGPRNKMHCQLQSN